MASFLYFYTLNDSFKQFFITQWIVTNKIFELAIYKDP